MANLLGNPFSPWVTQQINVRQKALGEYSNISSKTLQYYTTKTPWIRLASSVNLNNTELKSGKEIPNSVYQKLIDSGLTADQISGNNLAKNLILQGGVVSSTIEEDNISLRGLNSGLNTQNALYEGAYGWGGVRERGYVPMPGITQADVQYLNNGALTKTTINIRCFSKRQFQLIDVLYLRPGYSLLLEFGHSVYLDNDESLQSFDNFSTEPLRTLLNPGEKDQYTIYRQIAEEREKHRGNYEAVFGKISNFNWQFNSDGSYDCQVVLTGMGDVIESLKVNIALDDVETDSTSSDTPTEKPQPPVISNKNKTLLNQKLYNLYQGMKSPEKGITFYNYNIGDFPDPDNDFKPKTLKIPSAGLSIPGTKTNDEENQSPQAYITFGALMALIQSRLMLYDKKATKSVPIATFDMNFNNLAQDENYILKFPGEFSADPRVCLIPYFNTSTPLPDLKIPSSSLNKALIEKSKWTTDSLYAGRLAAIFLNINYVARVLEESPTNEENAISLLGFLQTLIKGITQALGGFNKIRVQSSIDGKIQFIEEIPQRLNQNASEDNLARFNVFGVKPGVEGSFIKNVNLTADLSSDFATMISIGAQNNGNQISANATSFSNYNAGLTDRVVTEKSSYITTPNSSSNEEVKETIESNWGKINANENSLFLNTYGKLKFVDKNISALSSFNTNHASLILGRLTKQGEDQQLQAPFFLPFNFQLEMEGLSGMLLYQKFLISEDILPPSYEKGGVEIQIKGINHSIDTTSWTTKLETLSVPAAKLSKEPTPYPLSSVTEQSTPGATQTESSGEDKGVTSPNGYTVGDIYYDGPSPKKQIFIHHTAGGQNIRNVVSGWNRRTDRVSTHFITNNSGQVERIFADEAWANHLGIRSSYFRGFGLGYQNLNKTSLGIEMCSFGGLKLVNGEYRTYVNSTIPANEVARPVDKNGKETTYKGYTYYHKYSNAHIENVRKIIVGWKNKYGIPFKYDYDTLFTYNKTPFTGAKGIYTHNSVRQDKIDVFPQKELIDMLKSISD